MGQIAFACNRRNNAMQHRNGLMTRACGANDRLTMFLYDCGLTTSRWATLQAAASLTKANSTELKEIGSNKYFHVTVDNIDVTRHVNDRQFDRRTELLHRTFGYAHIQNGDIAGAYNLRAYSAHQASLPRVNLQHLLPTPQSDSSSTTGIKAQIYRALARLVLHLGLSLLDAHHPPVLVIDGQFDVLSKGLVIGVVQLPVQLAVSPGLLRYDNRVLSLSIEIGSLKEACDCGNQHECRSSKPSRQKNSPDDCSVHSVE
ncbi:BZ3500_MvSof-1268-A1-R1_Chr8-2g10058 [Microbotryum saponariae]|uniref:BZ3500_MvSof-1268-A1-R1_Chr8-2g10058 protein n=1 Tax=Microbotryum saponariae TaxID=289078 RepID=A0A2X0LAL6_9BASI|nr:BZ3500_MvSof-1268-A1-R1_Chr8-2g10058 [Microbotryum saponariae]SDA01698.1 BZ3501_MvSof-1269-A2-R1_Chr8-2g09808 [Microbotryum saponariae]